MKRLFSVVLMFVSLICLSACNKLNFSHFKDGVNNINGYKYYVVEKVIFRDDLILYQENKSVYLNNENLKIVLDSKSINDLDDDELYSNSSSEYYVSENKLYYKENDLWKVKENSSEHLNLGFEIKETMFENYSIYKNDGRDCFKGNFKDSVLGEFLGIDTSEINDAYLFIELNSKGSVISVSFNYVSDNGNNVRISLKPNYSYVLNFEVPIVE